MYMYMYMYVPCCTSVKRHGNTNEPDSILLLNVYRIASLKFSRGKYLAVLPKNTHFHGQATSHTLRLLELEISQEKSFAALLASTLKF